MKFFVDTAEIDDIKELAATGLLDGVTTNPSLIAKSGRDFMEVTKEICGIVDGPVSAEGVALDHETMMKEAEVLRKIAMAPWSMSPCAFRPIKRCLRRKLVRPSSRHLWVATMITVSTAWT